MNQSTTPIRWRGLLISLGILTLVEAVLWSWFQFKMEDASFQAVSVVFYLVLVLVVFSVWWVFFSRIPLVKRAIGLVLFILLGFGVKWSLRFDGYGGSSLPQITHRWDTPAKKTYDEPISVQEEVLSLSEPLQVDPSDWPQYRGAKRDGVVRSLDAPVDWVAIQEIWRQPVGLGWSSFAVVGPYAFTQEQRQEKETTVCYELATGKTIWVHEEQARFSEAMGGDGPRATPTFYQGKLLVQGATGILGCLDAKTGQLVWKKNILTDNGADLIEWGMAGSPLVVEDTVYVSPGGSPGKSMVAYHLKDGSLKWSAGDARASYSSPSLHVFEGAEQLLIFNALGLFSHDLESGKVLWQYPYENFAKANAAQPELVGDDKVLITAGYSKGGVLIRPALENGQWIPNELWVSRRIKTKFNTVVVDESHAYGFDEGILVCIDLESGDRTWKGGRYGYGQLLLVGDELLVQAESGELMVVAADPSEHRLIAQIPALHSKTWNHPAIGQGHLLVRNGEEAVCYKIKSK